MRKIILVNGPPKSGKDTIGWDIMDWLHFNDERERCLVTLEKFAGPLRKIANSLNPILVTDFEEIKDEKVMVGGLSPRKIMQSASEDWLKKLVGPTVFAELLHQRIHREMNINQYVNNFVVVTDCGFQTEVDYIVDKYGEDNVYLIRMMREGCNFIGDTREFTNIPKRSHFATITNNGSYDDLKSAAASVLSVWFGKKEAGSD